MRGVVGSVLIAVSLGIFTEATAQLPPEIMADRYLVQAERLMKEKDFKAALEAMEKIVALQKEHDLKLPDGFHFKYAQIAMSAGLLDAAIDAVSRYLVAAGRTGKFYREALELLDQAEQKQAERDKIQAGADEKVAEAERLIAEKNEKAAADLVNQLLDLRKEHDLTLRDEFHFVHARAAFSEGRIKAAMDAANRYLSAAGPSGQYYGEAQELLAEAEQLQMSILPEMVAIPGGSFRMGCVSGLNCRDDEKPVHRVRVASFELSKYEVTFEEYDHFIAETGRRSPKDEGWGRGRRPVINVSWEDAVAYTEWLSAQTGERYRLPSEAEWEYAARAGSESKFHFGNDASQLCRYGNHADTSTDFDWRNTACSDGVGKRTATVGSYQPNAFELHDVHGNVVGVGAGLLERQLSGGAGGRLGLDQRGLRKTRVARRFLALPTWNLRAAVPRQGHHRRSVRRTTVSVWPGRSPLESLTLYLGVQGAGPLVFFSVLETGDNP